MLSPEEVVTNYSKIQQEMLQQHSLASGVKNSMKAKPFVSFVCSSEGIQNPPAGRVTGITYQQPCEAAAKSRLEA